MQIDVLTLFPQMVESYVNQSLLGSAVSNGVISIKTHDFRVASDSKHGSVDDTPFGGGAGMVLSPQPLFSYIEKFPLQKPIIYLTPTGETFNQSMAEELSKLKGFTLLCGRYEGIDQRVIDNLVDRSISLGDFILAGGESAANVIIEATCRLVPGVLGNDYSTSEESFYNGLLEYPQYTRPSNFEGYSVPKVLLSGDHKQVERWRKAQSLHLTHLKRPDLIEKRGGFKPEEKQLLKEFGLEV